MTETFYLEQVVERLHRIPDKGKGKNRDFLYELLGGDRRDSSRSKEFKKFLFDPKEEPGLAEKQTKLYEELIKKETIKTIVEMIDEHDPEDFDRNVATLCYSVCNMAILQNNTKLEEIEARYQAKELTRSETSRLNEEIVSYNEEISKLLKRVKKIVKREAKRLASDTSLPKYVCYCGMYSVPEPEYVTRFKVSGFLSYLLPGVYSEVAKLGGFPNHVDWKRFFQTIFGKGKIVEVATYILLEGAQSLKKYKGNADVRNCWDSLTDFALDELNDAPDSLRDQMMDLYLKRVSRSIQNPGFELRADLRSIKKTLFPKLWKTLEHHWERFNEILSGISPAPEAD